MDNSSEDIEEFLNHGKISLPTYKNIALWFWDAESRFYEQALDDIFRNIEELKKHHTDLINSNEFDQCEEDDEVRSHLDWTNDLYSETIEIHIGSVFILCQRLIHKRKESYKLFWQKHKENGRSMEGPKPEEILKAGTGSIDAVGESIHTIYQIANYIKHSEEWNHDWIDNDGNDKGIEKVTKQTMRRIAHKLCQPRMAGICRVPPSLRSILPLFGINDMTTDELRKLPKQIKDWQDHVYKLIDSVVVPPRLVRL